MKDFYAHALFGDGRVVEKMAALLESFQKPNAEISKKNCASFVRIFGRIGRGCDYLSLPAAKASCDEIVSLCSKASDGNLPRLEDLKSLFTELISESRSS